MLQLLPGGDCAGAERMCGTVAMNMGAACESLVSWAVSRRGEVMRSFLCAEHGVVVADLRAAWAPAACFEQIQDMLWWMDGRGQLKYKFSVVLLVCERAWCPAQLHVKLFVFCSLP